MRQATYAVPGIDEHAVQIAGLRMLVQLLLNTVAAVGADTRNEVQANLDAMQAQMMAALDVGEITSDVPSENDRIRATARRYLRDTFAGAQPWPDGKDT